MSLQWYPGHMTKARRELVALMPSQDVVIEVIDARLPGASSNPLLRELRGDKPCVKVLARCDLADPERTDAWLTHLEREPNVRAFAAARDRPEETRKQIRALCAGMARARGRNKSVRALVVGVPNVGKSTLINTLMHRTVAAVGDKPAVTKEQQVVVSRDGMRLTDSPGLMWPKIVDERGALRLALAGSIPETAYDFLTIGMFGAGLMLAEYPALLSARFKLAVLPSSAEALLHEIGRRRGALRPGGAVELHKASEILAREFRSGAIGRMTLELPPV